MQRVWTVSFSLIALTSLVAMQAVPRIVAICQQQCGSKEACVAVHSQASPSPEPSAKSGCCQDEVSEAAADQVPGCQRRCAPGIEVLPKQCGDRAVPIQERRREECRRNMAPCDACIPSQLLIELPPDVLASKTSPSQQRGHGVGDQASASTHGKIVRSHSPPALRLALTCAERCVVLRVLLI